MYELVKVLVEISRDLKRIANALERAHPYR